MSRTLGEFEQLVLFAIVKLGDDAYGAAIAAAIEDTVERDVSSGALYTTLERLENRGLVQGTWGDPTAERGGRRRKFYVVEPRGAALLAHSFETLRTMGEDLMPAVRSIAGRGDSGP